MRRFSALLLFVVCFWTFIKAQNNYTINGTVATITNATAGSIYGSSITGGTIPDKDKPSITDLTISGTIDASDFTTIKKDLTSLTRLDVSGVSIAAYSGSQGPSTNTSYDAAVFPAQALYGRSSITSVIFPATITKVGEGALSGTNIQSIASLPASVLTIDKGAFYGCGSLTNVTLPQSIQVIGYKSFESNTGLLSITIPAGIQEIQDFAFSNCSKLTNVYIKSDNPANITVKDAFGNGNAIIAATLHVPIGYKSVYATATPFWSSFNSILEDIGNAALTLKNGVATVTDATPGCFVKGVIPDASKPDVIELKISGSIDASDFLTIREGLTKLTKLDLSETTISAYYGSKGPSSTVTSYAANVFPTQALEGKDLLKTIIFPASVVKIDRFSFYKSGIESVTTLPSSVLSIEEEAFGECANLSNVILPSSLKTIGNKAFVNDPMLPSVFLPASVSAIGESAFEACSNLLDVFVESSDPKSATLYASSFNDPTTKTLHVPVNSSSSYAGTSYWKLFGKIMEGIKRPTISTLDVSSITGTTAIVKGTITDLGDTNPTQYGVVWSASGTPTVNLSTKTEEGGTSSTLAFNSSIGGLNTGTTYSVRAYATNSAGTAYGSTLTFTTPVTSATINGTTATITGATAGCLTGTTLLTNDQKKSIISLTVSGTIDASDFKVMRDTMTAMTYVDLTNTTIAEYFGPNGTSILSGDRRYGANHFPDGALNRRSNLTFVGLPTSITEFERFALNNCNGLTSITIPNGLTTIGYSALAGIDNLRTFVADNNPYFSTIDGVLYNNSKTTIVYYPNKHGSTFSIPNSVTAIGDDAFNGCSALTAVTIPSSVTTIGGRAFQYCAGLTQLTIPTSVTSMADYALSGCTGLTSIAIPSSVTYLGVSSLESCTGLTSVVIPPSVKNIHIGTFKNCTQLKTVTLPSSINSIGSYSFYGCRALSVLNVYPATPVDISSNKEIFTNVPTSTCVLRVPSGSLNLYKNNTQWGVFTNIAEGIVQPTITTQAATSITVNSATGNGTITNFGDVQPIKYGHVWSTTSGPTVDLPTRTEFPGSFTSPFTSAITGLSPGTTYYVRAYATNPATTPTAGTVYGQEVSFTTGALAVVSTDNKTATITGATTSCLTGSGLLSTAQKSALTSLTISGTIDARDFKVIRDEMPQLTSIDLTNATIAAFDGLGGTISTSWSYPANELPSRSFDNRLYIKAIVIPTSTRSIGSSAFFGCSALPQLDIPASVTTIGPEAFLYCSSLKSISIPASVSTIFNSAFAYCFSLETINAYPVDPVKLDAVYTVFYGTPVTCLLHVPSGSLSSYKTAAQWKDLPGIVEGFTAPTVTTQAVTNVTTSTATYNGNMTNQGDVTPVQYGFVWNTASKPTVDLTTRKGLGTPAGTGAFTASITGLNPGTTYYVRAYATNPASTPAAGTVYGEEVSFTTTKMQLTVSTPPTIARKIYDGLSTATVTNPGKLSGITDVDLANVTISTTATFDDEKTGTGKTVMVHYTLGGTAASNYIAPADYKLTTGEIDKGLTLNIILEGLWNATNKQMNKCRDWDNSQSTFVDKFPNDIVDQLTVELHGSPYSNMICKLDKLNLHQNGTITSDGLSAIAVPPTLSGSYYITVKSRNHLPVTSVSMISFSGNSVGYDFTDRSYKAYSSDPIITPTKSINDKWMLYAGNVNDEDPRYEEINIGDLYQVFNNRSGLTKSYGYTIYDLDGNGDVDVNDVYTLFHNRDAILYIP